MQRIKVPPQSSGLHGGVLHTFYKGQLAQRGQQLCTTSLQVRKDIIVLLNNKSLNSWAKGKASLTEIKVISRETETSPSPAAASWPRGMFSAGSAPEAPPGESRPAGTWAGGWVAGRAPSAPRPLEAETQPHPHRTLGSLIPLLRPTWAPLPRSLPRPPGAPGGQRVAGARPLPESRSAEEAEAAAAPRPRRAHGVVRVLPSLIYSQHETGILPGVPRKLGLTRALLLCTGHSVPAPTASCGSPAPSDHCCSSHTSAWTTAQGAPARVLTSCQARTRMSPPLEQQQLSTPFPARWCPEPSLLLFLPQHFTPPGAARLNLFQLLASLSTSFSVS